MTQPSRSRISLLVCTALALAAPLAGCSGDDGDGGGAGAGDFGIAAGLAELPEQEDGPLRISVADVSAVSEANGLDVPDSVEAAGGDWLGPVTGSDDSVAMLSPPGSAANLDPAAFAGAAGFSWVESDWFASVSMQPDAFAVYAGSARSWWCGSRPNRAG